MNLDGVVPVAVPLEPGHPTRMTIPRETHIMYWCILYPEPSPPSDTDTNTRDRELLASQRQLLQNSELRLQVDGETVPLLDDVCPEFGLEYWTVVEPLSPGTYTLEITITYRPESQDESALGNSAPPAYSLPGESLIPWDEDAESTVESTLIVTEAATTERQTETDPLWDRKDVYPPLTRTALTP